MNANKEYFTRVDMETYQALRAFLHSEKMLKEFTKSDKEVKIDMCQALEELYQDGVREGKIEGIRAGHLESNRKAAINLDKMGMPAEAIARAVEEDVSVVKQWLRSVKHQ